MPGGQVVAPPSTSSLPPLPSPPPPIPTAYGPQVWAGDVVTVQFLRDGHSFDTVIRTEHLTAPAPPPLPVRCLPPDGSANDACPSGRLGEGGLSSEALREVLFSVFNSNN